ncbi:MAG: ABC transporter ATP-binding protein [Opitutaceae bacterium]
MSFPKTTASAPAAPGLRLDAVGFAYASTPVLSEITLDLASGSFVSLLGPSGCGKTTLLRLLAGLALPTAGSLAWRGAPIAGPSLERGVVFQDYSLFPWMTLAANVELALAKAQPALDRHERHQLAEEYLALVGLGDATAKHPFELSGGMQQRGAIARTFALGSPVLLMDEPFGALDPVNRAKLQDLLLNIWSGSTPRKTVVFVTHDIEEALYLSDRIVMLGSTPGRVIQELDVPFARPRQRRELVRSPEFAALRQRIEGRFQQDLIDRIEAESLVATAAEGI